MTFPNILQSTVSQLSISFPKMTKPSQYFSMLQENIRASSDLLPRKPRPDSEIMIGRAYRRCTSGYFIESILAILSFYSRIYKKTEPHNTWTRRRDSGGTSSRALRSRDRRRGWDVRSSDWGKLNTLNILIPVTS